MTIAHVGNDHEEPNVQDAVDTAPPSRSWQRTRAALSLSPLELLAVLLVLIGLLASCTPATEPSDETGDDTDTVAAPDMPVYLDATASVPDRVADLLGRMTLDDKIGQMTLIEKGYGLTDMRAARTLDAVIDTRRPLPRPSSPSPCSTAWTPSTATTTSATR